MDRRGKHREPATKGDGVLKPARDLTPPRERVLVKLKSERRVAINVLERRRDPPLDVAEFGFAVGEVDNRGLHRGESIRRAERHGAAGAPDNMDAVEGCDERRVAASRGRRDP